MTALPRQIPASASASARRKPDPAGLRPVPRRRLTRRRRVPGVTLRVRSHGREVGRAALWREAGGVGGGVGGRGVHSEGGEGEGGGGRVGRGGEGRRGGWEARGGQLARDAAARGGGRSV